MESNLDVEMKSTYVVTNLISQNYGVFGSNEALGKSLHPQPWWYQSCANDDVSFTFSRDTPATSWYNMHYNSSNTYNNRPGAASRQYNNSWYHTNNQLDSPDSGYFSPSFPTCDTPDYTNCRVQPSLGSRASSCALSGSGQSLQDSFVQTPPIPQYQTSTLDPKDDSLVLGGPSAQCSSGTTDRRCAKRNLNYSPPPREGTSCKMVIRTPSVAKTVKQMQQIIQISCLESLLTTHRAVLEQQDNITLSDNYRKQWRSCMMAKKAESGGPNGIGADRNSPGSMTQRSSGMSDCGCRQRAECSDQTAGFFADQPEHSPGFPVGLPVLFTGSLETLQNTAKSEHKSSFQLVCFNCADKDTMFLLVSKDESSTNQTRNETACQPETTTGTQCDQLTQDAQKTLVSIKTENFSEVPSPSNIKGRKSEECSRPSRLLGDGSNKRGESLDILTMEAGQLGSQLCFGCQKPVFDRYVIQVKDHGFWHADCLKCSNCQDNLSGHRSCYVKNEQVFCRNDYNILFGLSCVKCSLQFKREQDWMRVAGQHRYHIACFLCKICKRQLGNNEKYHLVNGTDIYCTNHYRDMVNGDNADGQQPPKKAKRNRTSYTEAQIKFLQDRFLRDSNPDGNELEKIASHINLKKRVVQVWFQNNRARLKKSANNNKGGSQENKNSSMNNGVTGGSVMSEIMDWDNSLEHSSLDEHTFPNSSSPQAQLRPGSAHFLDSSFGVSPGLAGSLICLTSGTPVPTGHDHSTFCDSSGTSTCGTPRDQSSPQFSEMSNPPFPAVEITTHDNRVEELAASNYSKASGGPISYHIKDSSGVNTTSSGGENRASPAISFSKSSGISEKCYGRSEDHTRHSGLPFHEPALRHPPHPFTSSQLYSSESPYGAHLGLYGNLYNMYTGYAALHDPHYDLSEHQPSFLRIKEHQRLPGFVSGVETSYETPYGSEASLFSRTQLVDASSGFMSTRSPFSNRQVSNARASDNTSPLSFLGSSTSLHQPRAAPGHCSYPPDISSGIGLSCGQSLSLLRSCSSPEEINPNSYLHSTQNRSSETYFPNLEHV